MAAIISVKVDLRKRPDQVCGICSDFFEQGSIGWTHPEAKHDPFHQGCLKKWLYTKPQCPYCKVDVNADSLLSRAERIGRFLVSPVAIGCGLGIALGTAILAVRQMESTILSFLLESSGAFFRGPFFL